MAKLIGQITYPKDEAFAVEYAKLYSENDGTTLEFRLVNNGKKTVNAYRVDLSYSVNGEEKSQSFQGRNLDLAQGNTTDIITCSLAGDVEEGTLTLSAVIYDDLSHSPTEAFYPFASFDAISRKAESMLAGGVPANAAAQTPKTIATAPVKETAQTASDTNQELNGKKSRLPLILALSSLGGFVLTFILRLIAYDYIIGIFIGTVNSANTVSGAFLIVSLICMALFTACAALALTAILLGKNNPRHRAGVLCAGIPTLLLYLYFQASALGIFFLIPLVLATVFFILSLVKKNMPLLIVTASMILLLFTIMGMASGCDIGCANAQEAAPETTRADSTVEGTHNTPAVTERETDTYFVLEYEQISSDECMVSRSHIITYASNDYSTPEPYYIPVLNDVIDLTIPEFSPSGLRVVGIADEAFQWNETIRSVTLPTGITTIGETAFANCTRLENVKGLENVVEIKAHAFRQCPQLKEVSLGEGLQSIGFQAFAASGLVRVYLPAALSSIDTMVFTSCTDLLEVEICASISAIPTSFFAGCTALHTVKIPDSVERIDADAFYNCFSLSTVFYEGDENYWNQIGISSGNDALYNANVEFHVQ